MNARPAFGVVGAIFAPFCLMLAYLHATRGPHRSGFHYDTYAFVAAIALGFAFTFLVHLKWLVRLAVFVVYVPACWFVLLVCGMSYVCSAFGDCM